MSDLAKVFEHKVVDQKWYSYWDDLKAFRADPNSTRPAFSMVLPPPNVTGTLHIGHALNQTLPDIIARWKRMSGFDVLWLPGTDHAGIATQNVVEKQLAAEGKTRYDLGRISFEARVWDWVKESHGTITSQMRKLGSSVDWSRERFTLDEKLSAAVRRVFVTLYREGLVYRGRYLVSWCTRCRTALSDLEVIHKPTRGKLYHVKYQLVDNRKSITVATTRPETLLGDTAVAVHPSDGRYSDLVGRKVRLPFLGRDIPIIADESVDPEFGTGAVKVTPAHDVNDFAIGERHNLEQIEVIDKDGLMTGVTGSFSGMGRFEARDALVSQLEADRKLVRIEDHEHAVGHCERCSTVVEPLLSTQWFVRIKPLADQALRAVEQGRTKFVPDSWTKTYNDWMTNIHDWCISRQLWWGHRIPAWYCESCNEVQVEETAPDVCVCGGKLRQDTDVLDTWFSSGLWPFSTLGWPEKTDELRRYYPTSLMITAHDIIFFWIARMMMLGLWFQKEVPFRSIYITSLVRDAHGQKMSKSKGNVVDPLELMNDIGADAFRFTLASLASPGMDISLSEGRLRNSRQFINKVWNVSRFVLMNLQSGPTERPSLPELKSLDVIHRWILHRVSVVAQEVNSSLEHFRFDAAADRVYQFVWHEYADWYIELAKHELKADPKIRDRALSVLIEVHDRVLRLLHPFVPFVTEEIWQALPQRSDDGLARSGKQTITLSAFPVAVPDWLDEDAVEEMKLVREITTTIRTVRSEWGVPPSEKISAVVQGANRSTEMVIRAHSGHMIRLARLVSVQFESEMALSPDTVRRIVREFQIHIPLAGVVDRVKEAERVRRELNKLVKQADALAARLANNEFVERADPVVVSEARTRKLDLESRVTKFEQILEELDV